MSSDYEIKAKQLPPEDGGGYLAWVPDLPGCISDGDTLIEAVASVRTAIDEWIAEAVRLNRAVPAPTHKRAAHQSPRPPPAQPPRPTPARGRQPSRTFDIVRMRSISASRYLH